MPRTKPQISAESRSLPRGTALLRDPSLNKGTAFSEAEREAFGLRGLLPPHVATQEEQVARVLENFRRSTDDLERYMYLARLLNRNEALFFRVLIEHPDELTPIVYTPTVGLACQRFGHIFERPRGLFVSADDRGRIAEVMRNWHHPEAAIIVVSDGERILGLGDLGANGMGIPVGKLALYTACAGVAPRQCLPVMLDVGTENESLLADPLYVGLHRRRLRGAEYDAMIEEFVAASQQVFPGVLVQFEDFATSHAFELLARYRDRICTFNDDIQGTGAVALAGLYSAARATGTQLRDQRILCFGAGEAATGICDITVAAMVSQGLPEKEARSRCWLFNSKGLVVASRRDLRPHLAGYAHDHPPITDFVAAVEALRPTAIVGVSGVPGAFSQRVIETLARLNQRPIVFSLSNPTSLSECSAEQAYRWSQGRALFASGSPYPPVTIDGRSFVPRQGNNSYIFPGVGLGAILCRARRVTDEMFGAAARALAAEVTQADLDQGSLYPPLSAVREVSARIATEVIEIAHQQGIANKPRPTDVAAFVRASQYDPRYKSYV
jgi:malate dehydrogenase (oxaloacetate-decarboxylating)(NADP+)